MRANGLLWKKKKKKKEETRLNKLSFIRVWSIERRKKNPIGFLTQIYVYRPGGENFDVSRGLFFESFTYAHRRILCIYKSTPSVRHENSSLSDRKVWLESFFFLLFFYLSRVYWEDWRVQLVSIHRKKYIDLLVSLRGGSPFQRRWMIF